MPEKTRALLTDPAQRLFFSVASIWEVAIKQARGRADFEVDAHLLRSALLTAGWEELPVMGDHATATIALPSLHKDPFDRLLLAQAIVENLTLLTSDAILASYPGPVLRV
ncbi:MULTISPECIES: type II toxin-antitoxin system VapC family toxin [unclassified Caulobacter]|uniref:type II toxin-antitoxin system VapC family toxin n=1 Tax=Caulobacter sp. D5 TaxID=357400 RepID=UPI001E419C85|nr:MULTISPECIES: type II toxin-antitoxin system VapC family toxin [unclassified Caulobacter]